MNRARVIHSEKEFQNKIQFWKNEMILKHIEVFKR